MMEELGLIPKTDDWAHAKMNKEDLVKLISKGEREQEEGQWSAGLGFGEERRHDRKRLMLDEQDPRYQNRDEDSEEEGVEDRPARRDEEREEEGEGEFVRISAAELYGDRKKKKDKDRKHKKDKKHSRRHKDKKDSSRKKKHHKDRDGDRRKDKDGHKKRKRDREDKDKRDSKRRKSHH
jgi:hypothetical protein